MASCECSDSLTELTMIGLSTAKYSCGYLRMKVVVDSLKVSKVQEKHAPNILLCIATTTVFLDPRPRLNVAVNF